jgi:hypothetical protein
MKTLITILFLSTGIFAQSSFDKVSWLTGYWGGINKDGSKYEECWTSPTADFMQGSGRMSKNGTITMREHLTIEKDGDDIFLYVLGYDEKLTPEEQGTIAFKLVKSSKTELVFENPKHNYPQRIIYKKDKKGNIAARVEQLDGSDPIDFPLNKPSKKK